MSPALQRPTPGTVRPPGRDLRKVLIAFRADNPTVRDTLAGIRRYERQTRGWTLALPAGDARLVDDYLEHWNPDGLIGIVSDSLLQRARRHGVKVVSLVSTTSMPAELKVYNDPEATARWVVEHFRERQLEHLRLLGDAPMTPAMSERVEAFARCASQAGCSFARFPAPGSGGARRVDVVTKMNRLARWLGRQPTPLGLWAVNDASGWIAAQACGLAGLQVPDDVAIVGYKNQQNLCEFCQPPLSSVQLDQDQIGYRAASLLDALMRGDPLPEEPVRVPPLGVVLRRSSDTVAVDDAVVRAAVRFIREHACHGIRTADVVDHVPASASTLLRRFAQHLGRSPADEIKRVRMQTARRLLRHGEDPLAVIADDVGYSHLSQFCREFKLEHGLTPSQFRQRGPRT